MDKKGIIQKYLSKKMEIQNDNTLPTELKETLLKKLQEQIANEFLKSSNSQELKEKYYFIIDLKDKPNKEIVKFLKFLLKKGLLDKLSFDGEGNLVLKADFSKDDFFEFIIEAFGIESNVYKEAKRLGEKNDNKAFRVVVLHSINLISYFENLLNKDSEFQECVKHCASSECVDECCKKSEICKIYKHLKEL